MAGNSRFSLFATAATGALTLFSGGALAQSSSNEIVVTGSFIAGTPETAALPVNVIGADELQRQGNPNTVELMKSLPSGGGVSGDNTYASGGIAGGVATANLRNLGAERTLVLLNGRRLPVTPVATGAAVDLNALPQAAIGRIEVLKDGAAATYGSDAIGGVMNFITRKNFDGLLVSGSARYVNGAEDLDADLGVNYGFAGDRGDVLFSFGWQQKGQLRGRERTFNQPAYLRNPEANWSPANSPGAFFPIIAGTPSSTQIRDPGCAAVGAVPGFSTTQGSNAIGGQTCFSRLTTIFGDIINAQNRWQFYAETNYELSDNLTFHGEAYYGESMTTATNSPSYPTVNGAVPASVLPTPPIPNFASGTSSAGLYFIPASNPGLVALQAQYPGYFPAGLTGLLAVGQTFRPLGPGGSLRYENQNRIGHYLFRSYRYVAGFNGEFGDSGVNFDVAATWHKIQQDSNQSDQVTYRQELALRGFGNLASNPTACNATVTSNFTTNAGNNAVGCYYLNPFSNNFQTFSTAGVVTPGAANPIFAPSAANNPDMWNWIEQDYRATGWSSVFAVDAVLSGELGLALPGGNIGWAAGGQFRRNAYTTAFSDLNNVLVNPCADTLFTGSKNCAVPSSTFILASPGRPQNLEQNVYAAFAEVNLPITEALSARLAARFENYGENGGGETFNPKLDARWQVVDWLALRGSVGTTFRAPPLQYLDPQVTNVGMFLGGFYRNTRQSGNPNLEPETATTFSLGTIFDAGPARLTVDYWNFDFQDPFVVESAAGLIGRMFPTGLGNVRCGDPAFAALQARFVFDPDACAAANVSSVSTSFINAGGVKTDGLDIAGTLDFEDILSGHLTLGGDATYTFNYKVADVTTLAGTTAGFNAVGKLNFGTGYYATPRVRGGLYAEWEVGPHNLRVQTNYVSGYTDQRTAPFVGTLATGDVQSAALATLTPRSTEGKRIKAWYTTDITYRVLLPWETTAVFNVANAFDKDPPFSRTDFSYDTFIASGIGRTYKISLTKKF